MIAIFKDLPLRSQLLFFGFIWVLSFVLFGLISVFIVDQWLHLSPLGPDLGKESIDIYRWIQFISSIGIFVLPPIVAVVLFWPKPLQFLKLKRFPGIDQIGFILMIWLISTPVLNLVIQWNQNMSLPDFMGNTESLLRSLEDQAALLTEVFLNVETIPDLLINILVVAVVPAIGEELLFRGFIQQYMIKLTRNMHIGIWLSAFVFSLLHFQFFGFFPRMLLGALFGYLFIWSNSLWVPIVAHFINNAAAVLLSYYLRDDDLSLEELEKVGTGESDWYYAVISAVLLAVVLIRFRKMYWKQEEVIS